jgi:cell division protein YceG involved in septum cleavage
MIVPRPEDAHMSEHHPGVDVIKRVLMLRGDIEEVALERALTINEALIETNMVQTEGELRKDNDDGLFPLEPDTAEFQAASSDENLVEELARAADDELQQQGAQTTDTDLDYQAIDTKALVRSILDAMEAYESGRE